MGKGICSGPTNTAIDPRPVLRALMVGLDRWVKDGTAPPPSRYPRIDDGTLVAASSLSFPPGMTAPREPNPMHRFDYGKRYAQGIIDNVPPRPMPKRPTVLVPRVDPDGNEVAGVRMPDQAVPLATTTGWALRSADAGAAGELCYLDGLALPFAKTSAEREKVKDARPSLAERYTSPEDYVARVRARAEAMAKDGYLIAEDVERAVTKAQAVKW
jgi:hypothetical protein